MTFAEYASAALRTAFIQAPDYLALGLNGEAGEVAEIIKKKIRRKRAPIDWSDKDWNEADRERLRDELSDVLWYLAMLAENVGGLDKVAQHNVEKLRVRYPDE